LFWRLSPFKTRSPSFETLLSLRLCRYIGSTYLHVQKNFQAYISVFVGARANLIYDKYSFWAIMGTYRIVKWLYLPQLQRYKAEIFFVRVTKYSQYMHKVSGSIVFQNSEIVFWRGRAFKTMKKLMKFVFELGQSIVK
jgi:hypothetical protein